VGVVGLDEQTENLRLHGSPADAACASGAYMPLAKDRFAAMFL
jgi:hypothetical protein